MIIIQNPVKDTYVTDIKTYSNDGLYSNVGQSSTIDLFKISGENKKTNARGLLEFKSSLQPNDGDTFSLIDSSGTSKTFEFDNDALVVGDNILINIGLTIDDTVTNTINVINAVNNFGITSSKLYDNSILLKQDKSGESGDTEITVSGVNLGKYNFIRFEHSAGLLSFDLNELKNTHLPDITKIANSVFSNTTKFSAFIKLIDVGQSSTSPKNFSLGLSVLNNDFKEGLGKDVVHFSDIDDANFSVLDSTNNISWNNPGIVSGSDLFENANSQFSNNDIDTGKEDLNFDITNYIHEYFKETASFDKNNFVIHFPLEYLFNNNTYFVKRFGSRNLKNKQFVPQLVLKIDDREIENILTGKKRYFDNEETFFCLNIKGNKTSNFIENSDVKLRFNFTGDDDTNILSDIEITGSTIYNYKGEEIIGIRKFILSDTSISQLSNDSIFNSQISNYGYANIELEYFYEDGDGNQSVIKKDKEKFYLPESSEEEISFGDRNIRVSIDLLQKDLKANNTFTNLKISFIDINKQYKSVNVPTKLYSEDLGDITYEMYDVDSGVTLIKEDGYFTQLNFNGRHYNMNLFSSENFKNKRVNFIFKFVDPLTGLYKKVLNDNTILRFI